MSTGTIFCDESGYTGPDLLDPQDPYFSFASVAITPDEASELVNRIIRDYGIQGGELKGRRLLKFVKGRRAIAEILDNLHGRFKVALFEKRFALACKFFEYIFEPTLAQYNGIFYSLGFHWFIANLLHLRFTEKGRYADKIFAEFQTFMRTFDEDALVYLNGKLALPDEAAPLDLIGAFTVANFATVREEIKSAGESTGKWTLELSATSLHSLLCEWAEVYDDLDVTCDDSKPLAASKVVHDAMIGNDRKAYHNMFGDKRRLTFNLAKPIELVRSIECPGVQLADVVAAATAAVFENSQDPEHDGFRRKVIAGLAPNAVVLPLASEVDLKDPIPKRNYYILHDLVRRSLAGEPVLPGAVEFALQVTQRMHLPIPDVKGMFITE